MATCMWCRKETNWDDATHSLSAGMAHCENVERRKAMARHPAGKARK